MALPLVPSVPVSPAAITGRKRKPIVLPPFDSALGNIMPKVAPPAVPSLGGGSQAGGIPSGPMAAPTVRKPAMTPPLLPPPALPSVVAPPAIPVMPTLPGGIGASFARSMPRPAGSSPASPPPMLAGAGPRPNTFGADDFRNKPFGMGMNGEKPLLPYQGSQGNGAPPPMPGDPSASGDMEGDFVANELADSSTERHPAKYRRGAYKGMTPQMANIAARRKFRTLNAASSGVPAQTARPGFTSPIPLPGL